MNPTLKEKLLDLADTTKFGRFEKHYLQHSNVYELRVYQQELRNFILTVPEMLELIHIRLEKADLPPEFRRLYGYLLAYVYNSEDILPEERYGFWGYLDDAYLVGQVFQKTDLYLAPPSRQDETPSLSTQVASWLALTREVIPNECQKLDLLLGKLLTGQYSEFAPALAAGSR